MKCSMWVYEIMTTGRNFLTRNVQIPVPKYSYEPEAHRLYEQKSWTGRLLQEWTQKVEIIRVSKELYSPSRISLGTLSSQFSIIRKMNYGAKESDDSFHAGKNTGIEGAWDNFIFLIDKFECRWIQILSFVCWLRYRYEYNTKFTNLKLVFVWSKFKLVPKYFWRR